MQTLENKLQEALFSSTKGDGKKAEEIAEMLGLSSSMLYRAVSPDDAGAALKLAHLLPFMKLTRSIAPLRFLAQKMNAVVVKLPARTPHPGPKTLAEVQAEMLKCQTALLDFCTRDGSRAEALNAIYALIEHLIFTSKEIERSGQLPLEIAQRSLDL